MTSSLVSSGLIESRLAALAACAPPLDASAAALLSAQQSPADGAELPALAAVCSALGVPLSHSADPHEASSLPMRLVAGTGTAAELSLWRVLHDDGDAEDLSEREVIAAMELRSRVLAAGLVGDTYGKAEGEE